METQWNKEESVPAVWKFTVSSSVCTSQRSPGKGAPARVFRDWHGQASSQREETEPLLAQMSHCLPSLPRVGAHAKSQAGAV